jgi:hypothetical protein
VLLRCAEVASEDGAKKSVAMVHNDRLKDPAGKFLTAQDAVTKAEGAWAKENAESLAALADLDQPYQETLAVVSAYLPHEVLPATLKALPTDTDRLKAIGDLVDLLDLNQSEAWATEQLGGDFGTRAPQAVTELEESIVANKACSKARDERAGAYGLAYERYLAFKKVVRAAYGPTSKQYQRIHIRSGKSAEPTPKPTPQPTPPAS